MTTEQKEKRREYWRNYYAQKKQDPEWLAKERERKRILMKKRYDANREEINKRRRERYRQDPTQAKAHSSKSRLNNLSNRTLKKLKVLGGCSVCGYKKCHYALEYHHTNPEDKSFTLTFGNLRKYGWRKFLKEMDKCVLLCSNCHKEVHMGVASLD